MVRQPGGGGDTYDLRPDKCGGASEPHEPVCLHAVWGADVALFNVVVVFRELRGADSAVLVPAAFVCHELWWADSAVCDWLCCQARIADQHFGTMTCAIH